MERSQLIAEIKSKKSLLCIGLDSDVSQMPEGIEKMPDGVLKFNKAIIDATSSYAVAYKINTAFYESMGAPGWKCMEETLDYIPDSIFTIADAKRGDIGNTAVQYRRAFLERLPFDAITLNPYMGLDSMDAYVQEKGKWGIILGLTSNPGADDFEKLELTNGKKLYEEVFDKVTSKYDEDNVMFVIGATQGDELKKLREQYPEYFFLIPGVGAQGADIATVLSESCTSHSYYTLINASRSILFASSEGDFAKQAARVAQDYQAQMLAYMESQSII